MLRTLCIIAILMGCTTDTPRQPDVLLVTWDTVRADHVGGLYTPGWNALALNGAVFSEARSPVPITLPAHASIMTGRAPPIHGARDNGTWPIDSTLPTLAERFKTAGWTTAAFVSAAVLDERYGIGRGFSTYDDHIEKGTDRIIASRDGAVTVARAKDWLAAQDPNQPVFMWVHLFEPHRPWESTPALMHEFEPYPAEIALADELTTLLLNGIETRGRLDDAIVIITSDHGEGLGEHGETTHGYFAYESTIRVPLMIWAGPNSPNALSAGHTISGPATLLDIAPTLLQMANLPPMDTDGQSLVPHLTGTPIPPRDLSVETVTPALDFDTAPIFGVYDEQAQFWTDTPTRERYTLRSDPKQLVNRYQDADAAEANQLFARFPRSWPPTQDPMTLSEEERAQLEALGYVTKTAEGKADNPVDAKDRVALFELLTSTTDAPGEERLQIARAAQEEHGPVPALLLYIADLLDALGRSRDALAVLKSAVEAHPLDRDLQRERLQRAQKLDELQRLANAIQDRLSEHPDDVVALRDLALTLHRLQDFSGAEKHYRQVLKADPGNDEIRIGLARALASQERFEHALAALAPALQRPGHGPLIACTAGRIMAQGMNRGEEAKRLLSACD